MNISVIGDVLLDLAVDCHGQRENPEIPGSIIATSEHLEASLGGAGHVARLLSERHHVQLVAPVGGWSGGLVAQLCEHHGIALVALDAAAPNPVKWRVSHEGTYHKRLDVERVQPHVAAAPVLHAVTQEFGPDVVVLSDYAKGTFGPHSAGQVRQAIASKAPVFVDCKPAQVGLFAGCHAVTPNLREARVICGDQAPTAAAVQRIVGCDLAVVTRGKAGAAWAAADGASGDVAGSPGGPWIVGAGDAFLAALVEEMAHCDSYQSAVTFVNLRAALYTREPCPPGMIL